MSEKGFGGAIFVMNEVSGAFQKLGEIAGEFTASVQELSEELQPYKEMKLDKSGEFSFEANLDNLSGNEILLMLGLNEAIPNNWLRMNGYPMRRKSETHKLKSALKKAERKPSKKHYDIIVRLYIKYAKEGKIQDGWE